MRTSGFLFWKQLTKREFRLFVSDTMIEHWISEKNFTFIDKKWLSLHHKPEKCKNYTTFGKCIFFDEHCCFWGKFLQKYHIFPVLTALEADIDVRTSRCLFWKQLTKLGIHKRALNFCLEGHPRSLSKKGIHPLISSPNIFVKKGYMYVHPLIHHLKFFQKKGVHPLI